MTNIRILNGFSSALVCDQLRVLDYKANNGRCYRAIFRAEDQYHRPVSESWKAAAEAPWGTYLPGKR